MYLLLSGEILKEKGHLLFVFHSLSFQPPDGFNKWIIELSYACTCFISQALAYQLLVQRSGFHLWVSCSAQHSVLYIVGAW